MDEATIKSIREQSEKLANELSEFFDKVQQSVRNENISLTLNSLFLADACESCFIDMERHKDFHRIEIEDRHKRAAFIFKWLSKARPINVVTFSRGSGSGKALWINGYFALLVALGELNMNVKDFAKTIVAEHIIYAASYREINAEIWGLIFCLLETQYPEV